MVVGGIGVEGLFWCQCFVFVFLFSFGEGEMVVGEDEAGLVACGRGEEQN